MKIKFIEKQVLLILFASLLNSCVKKPQDQKKDIDYNSYTEHVVENHLLIRKKVQPFIDSIDYFAKDTSFENVIGPLMIEVDKIISRNDSLKAITRKDSLLYAMSSRLMFNYQEMIHRDFAEIYFIVDENIIENQSQKIDSIKLHYMDNDSIAIKYFNQYLDTLFTPLQPL